MTHGSAKARDFGAHVVIDSVDDEGGSVGSHGKGVGDMLGRKRVNPIIQSEEMNRPSVV